MSYRFVKITSFYREYLEYYYKRFPEIKERSYNEQLTHLMRQEFAWSDYYQRNLNSLGVEAHEIICNARYLQEAWAKENGFKQNGRALVFEQIKKIQPEVVFFQDTSLFNGEWIKHLKENIPSIKKIIGFRCSPYTADLAESFRCFDFIVVCSDQFVRELEQYQYKVYELNHAFEHTIIPMITENNSQATADLVFIGSLLSGAGFHSKRKQLIEKMIERNIHLDF
jgi:spore maturation protein CgeB